jgi:hypothetical protein
LPYAIVVISTVTASIVGQSVLGATPAFARIKAAP